MINTVNFNNNYITPKPRNTNNIIFKGSWADYKGQTDLFENLAEKTYNKTQDSLSLIEESIGKSLSQIPKAWEHINEQFKNIILTRQTTVEDDKGNEYLIKLGQKDKVTYTSILKKNTDGSFENIIKDKDEYLYTSSVKTDGEKQIEQVFKDFTLNKASYVISDLHIGVKNETDRFDGEKELKKFLTQISDKHKTDSVEVVLLGDSIDIWQVVSIPESKESEIPVLFPVHDEQEIANSVKTVNEDITKIFKVNSTIPTTIQEFLSSGPGKKIIYVIGNHDHPAVNKEVQEHIKKGLLGEKYNDLKDCIEFRTNYDNPELAVYGEHGNQYDKYNYYKDFSNFNNESSGYYVNVLFWEPINRLNPNPRESRTAIEMLIRGLFKFKDMLNVKKYHDKYKNDDRLPDDVKVIPKAVIILEDFVRNLLNREDLKSDRKKLFDIADDNSNPFSRKGIIKTLPTKFKVPERGHILEDVSKEVNKYEKGMFMRILPYIGKYLNGTDFKTEVSKFFEKDKHPLLKKETLDKDKYKFVLMGHTHIVKEEQIDEKTGIKYYNTGSWTKERKSNLPYITILKDEQNKLSSAVNYLSE